LAALGAAEITADWLRTGSLPVEPWNPWRALAEDHPNVTLVTTVELPAQDWGWTILDPNGPVIFLCKRLGPRNRTSTLCHELIHIERGILHSREAPEAEVEELIVCEIAARRLIPLPNLLLVLDEQPGGDLKTWAELLGCARPDVRDRIATLTGVEQSTIGKAGLAALRAAQRQKTMA
jgi:hypothetical protein